MLEFSQMIWDAGIGIGSILLWDWIFKYFGWQLQLPIRKINNKKIISKVK